MLLRGAIGHVRYAGCVCLLSVLAVWVCSVCWLYGPVARVGCADLFVLVITGIALEFRSYTHTLSHAQTRILHTFSYTHMHTHTLTHTHTHTLTRTHSHTHTTHTHAHTHTHNTHISTHTTHTHALTHTVFQPCL
jgi:carbohydrate-binding DOMON domain-containing protein